TEPAVPPVPAVPPAVPPDAPAVPPAWPPAAEPAEPPLPPACPPEPPVAVGQLLSSLPQPLAPSTTRPPETNITAKRFLTFLTIAAVPFLGDAENFFDEPAAL